MSTIVTHKGILVRINPEKNTIEHSKNKGVSWIVRCSLTNKGIAISLTDMGDELLLETTKGLFLSNSEGVTWTIKKSK
jgi:hypothetical protein